MSTSVTTAATVAKLLADATTRLATHLALDKREARIEARVLLAHALQVDLAWLIAHDRDIPAGAQRDAIESLIERRAGGEPIAYILGWREFYGRRFKVTPDVLIPRPETELLVEAALHRLPTDRIARILDLGTGSGCIAITLALEAPAWRITAVDINPAALDVAADNAAELGAQVEFLRSNWFTALPPQKYDLIISNPPYIAANDAHLRRGDLPREPRAALASGPDGLDAIRRIIAQAEAFLAPGGLLMLEHGWDQSQSVQTLLANAGYRDTLSLSDLAGVRRVAIGAGFSSTLGASPPDTPSNRTWQ
jgi:release factor glutamine methyltransferase